MLGRSHTGQGAVRSMEPIVRVENLTKRFRTGGGMFSRQAGVVQAVERITLAIHEGETLGLVGESGCGKTTLGRTILRLYEPTSGKVFFRGIDLTGQKGADLRCTRRHMQMVFQDPFGSLNPRLNVGSIIAEPLMAHGIGDRRTRIQKAQDLLEQVGLDPRFIQRYPHEFSGGQRQRIGIARAIALEPEFLVLDEPISSLDVSIQAQVVNLLEELQERLGLTYLFIAHDLSMTRHMSDRVAVMYLGQLVELANRNELFAHPLHPYTRALLSAVPVPDPRRERARKRIILEGEVPSAANPPEGCRFHPRCSIADAACHRDEPVWHEIAEGRWISCFHPCPGRTPPG